MKEFWLAGLALVALETAAIACSCVDTDDPAELRRYAVETANRAVALIEAETITAYDITTNSGERMRVVRTLAGTAPAEFEVHRSGFPSDASCGIAYAAGKKVDIILLAAMPSSGDVPVHNTAGLCTAHLLEKPVFRDALIRAIRSKYFSGERG